MPAAFRRRARRKAISLETRQRNRPFGRECRPRFAVERTEGRFPGNVATKTPVLAGMPVAFLPTGRRRSISWKRGNGIRLFGQKSRPRFVVERTEGRFPGNAATAKATETAARAGMPAAFRRRTHRRAISRKRGNGIRLFGQKSRPRFVVERTEGRFLGNAATAKATETAVRQGPIR